MDSSNWRWTWYHFHRWIVGEETALSTMTRHRWPPEQTLAMHRARGQSRRRRRHVFHYVGWCRRRAFRDVDDGRRSSGQRRRWKRRRRRLPLCREGWRGRDRLDRGHYRRKTTTLIGWTSRTRKADEDKRPRTRCRVGPNNCHHLDNMRLWVSQ